MLTEPALPTQTIAACLRAHYGVEAASVVFLPLGADASSAVYHVMSAQGVPLFLKLRWGNSVYMAPALCAFLHAQGIRQVIAPLATTAGDWSAQVEGVEWTLYPYLEGRNGFEVTLSPAQWVSLGAGIGAIHALSLPADLAARLPREEYAPRLRERVRLFDAGIAQGHYAEPIAAAFAAFWRAQRTEIYRIVDRAEELARDLARRDLPCVLCHGDLHAGNVLVGAGGAIAIVDWDDAILAPRERDLMFVGGGVGAIWNRDEEAAWFYQGYGSAAIDPTALAYYHYERIVADLAAYASQILGEVGSIEDREEGLRQVMEQFRHPGSVVAVAHRIYQRLAESGVPVRQSS